MPPPDSIMDPMDPNFNSSDVEFEPPPVDPRRLRAGQRSITAMIAEAGSLRMSTKRTARELDFASGAPGTRAGQTLWVNRFDSFRTEVLRHNLETPFTGEDLVRFFDAIIGKNYLLSFFDAS